MPLMFPGVEDLIFPCQKNSSKVRLQAQHHRQVLPDKQNKKITIIHFAYNDRWSKVAK